MSEPRQCVMRRCTASAAEGHAVCASCLPNVPARKPIDDTLAAIDAALQNGTGL